MRFWKRPRKYPRSHIKKTNMKKLKITRVERREFEKECRYVVV